MGAGRPKIDIDWKQFEAQCEMQCTMREIAMYFNCSPDTIERKVQEHYGANFAAVFSRKRQRGLLSLRVSLYNLAKKDGRVAVFLAKNWLGMSDKGEIDITTGGQPIGHDYKITTETLRDAAVIVAAARSPN